MKTGTRLLLWGVLAAQFCLGAQVTVRISPTHEFKLEFNPDAQVLYYPQIHTTENLSRKDRAAVLVSQFALLSFLKANPHYDVFAEGSLDYGPAEFPKLSDESFHGVFPGLKCPETLDQWKGLMQPAIINLGAPMVLFALGVMPRVHGAMPVETARLLDLELLAHFKSTGTSYATMDRGGWEIVCDKREKATAAHVKKFIASHPSRKALIVFGMDHDFRKHFTGSSFAEISGLEALKEWDPARRPADEGKEDERKDGEESKEPASPGVPPDADGPELIASVDAFQDNRRTQLMNAVSGKNLNLVQSLLAQGANVRLKDEHGYNALLLAGLGANVPMVEELLRHLTPADVTAPVTFHEEGASRSYKDILTFLEQKNTLHGHDYYDVLKCMKDFSAPPRSRAPGKSHPKVVPPEPAPGYLSSWIPFLPAWL